MDNGQGPPFFNGDSMGPLHCKLHFYDTMALFIETLTGTCFELRVSPWEAVISVKAKVQRLEGIPISQQHLIWSNVELEDDYCLNDYNISEGSTLKLVLAMRDGPINIRKVPMEDPLREMAEYMEAGQDEVWERTYNKQVTFLVYREGEQLNFFRVVDRGDGTLTPVSESLSAGSVCNAYTDEEEEAEPSPSGQQVIENSITMKKMKLLRAKMETMHLSKQPKKAVQLKLGPPHAPPSPAGSRAAARHRPLRVLPDIRPSRLCPPGAASGAAASPAAPTAGGVPKRAGDQESNTPPRSTRSAQLPSRISQGESGHGREPSLPRRTKPLRGNLSPNHEGGPLLFPISEKCVTAKPRLPEVGSSSWTEGRADRPRGALEGTQTGQLGFLGAGGEEGLPAGELHPRHAAGAPRGPAEPAALGRPGPSPHKGRRLEPLRSPPKPQRQARPGSGRLQPSAPHGVLRALAVRGTTARLRAVKVDSPGKRSDVISKVEARDITEMANKASREPAGCVNNVGLLASLAQGAGRVGGLRASGPGQVQGERVRKGSPQLESADFLLAARGSGMSGNDPAAGKRAGECTHHLPPVQAPIQTKKKTAKHCFLCGKKTGLATSYECRCGNNFCASHRYAETHGCTYDYKSAGRRYLQDANPVVNAPKLPKI